MSQIIDLNELVPESITVKIGDKQISLAPPSTLQMFRLADLGKKLQTIDGSNEEELREMLTSLEELVVSIYPELSDIQLLPQQLFKIVELISQMANPEAAGGQPEVLKAEES